MADYICAVRTNYFHVKDEENFREFASKIRSENNDLEIWEKEDENGEVVFGFGCVGSLIGVVSGADYTEDPSVAYDEFIAGLQENIAEDDAVIIYEVGREKLRYLSGYATVITSKEQDCLDVSDFAVKQARSMLNNQEWITQSSY